jgi:uncharacterized protein involved in propanediol utilization
MTGVYLKHKIMAVPLATYVSETWTARKESRDKVTNSRDEMF